MVEKSKHMMGRWKKSIGNYWRTDSAVRIKQCSATKPLFHLRGHGVHRHGKVDEKGGLMMWGMVKEKGKGFGSGRLSDGRCK